MSNINWFTDRVGQTVTRIYEDNKTEFEVTKKNIGYLQQFTEKGYSYIDERGEVCKPLTASNKPRVHSGPPESTCYSCEG